MKRFSTKQTGMLSNSDLKTVRGKILYIFCNFSAYGADFGYTGHLDGLDGI